jgi:multidrug resistance protein MdtO
LSPEGAAILAEINEALVHFATQPSPEQLSLTPPPAPESQSQSQPQSSAQPEKRAGGFFAADAFTNPVHVQYALKTTGAAMFCYVVYSLLDWPGIHASLITCYIVSLGTAAETVEKLRLRIFGCLIGAAAGLAAIVFLMPGVTSIGGLLAIVFLAALASGWVAGGSPRIAYAGFQIAFAFFLCVIQGSGPAFDLVVARDRVVGILLGNLVVYLTFTTLWPVSVASRIDPAIAFLLRSLSAMVAAANRSGRYLLAGEIRAALGALGQDLELARLEPARVRPKQHWLDARLRAKRLVTALQGSLLLGARLDPAFSSETTARLDRLADDAQLQAESAGDNEAPAEPRPQVGLAGSTSPIRERIRADLDDLERILVHRSGQEEHGWRAGHAPG